MSSPGASGIGPERLGAWAGRLASGLVLVGVAGFLTLFLLLPMVSLILVGFTGEPLNVLGYLASLDLAGLLGEIGRTASLDYYREFFEARRYRQGILNALGVAPLTTLLVWAPCQAGLGVTNLLRPGLARAARPWLGLPLALVTFTLTVAWGLAWPLLTPGADWPAWILPGRTWDLRLLQLLGYCPLVTLAATCLGTAMAWCVTQTAMPGRHAFRLLAVLPLAVPPFLGALAYKNLLGDVGIFTRLLESAGLGAPFASQSPLAAGFVQTFLFFPFVFLTAAAAMDRVDPSLGEAAEVLGARRGFSLWTVHLPVLLPGLSAGAFLTFIRSFGDFAALSLLLPIQYPMAVVEAYRDLSGSTYWGGASMLSTMMVLTILVLLAIQKYFIERGHFETLTGKGTHGVRLATRPLVRWAAFAFCAAVMSVPGLFVAATFLVSVSARWGLELLPSAYTLSRYGEILARLLQADSPLTNSFALVLPALLGAALLALIVAYTIQRSRHWSRHLLDLAMVLPFVVPGVAFAVALIGLFNGPPLALHLTVTLVVCAFIVTKVPYGVRSTLASFQQIGVSMEESSKTLGATHVLTLAKVTVPLILPGLLAGMIMMFISCMQDVAIALMVGPPDWYPASVFVFHQIQQGDVFGASAYGIVLLLLILIPYVAVYRLGGVRTTL